MAVGDKYYHSTKQTLSLVLAPDSILSSARCTTSRFKLQMYLLARESKLFASSTLAIRSRIGHPAYGF